MSFFQGKMAEYTGNRMGSFGSVGAASGNATKAPKGRGRGSVGKGNPAKSPGRRTGGKTVNPMSG